MARGSQAANTAATSAQNQFGNLASNASSLYSTLSPELQAEAAAPSGFGPATMAKMTTANMQGAGGSQAGAVGQGGLLAARTRNAGGPDAAIAESTRRSGQQLGDEALKTQIADAELKAKQQQAGLTGEENLYGTNLSAADRALGIVPQAVNADVNQQNETWNWAKDILDPLIAAGGSAAGGLLGRKP